MCGIVGVWNFSKRTDIQELKIFTDSLAHRGPDGAGYELLNEDSIGFGHRRLSVLDLSLAAKQPMSFADGAYCLTFNGEIYNFIELRKVLQNAGYKFRSDSDSEVILAAYDHWGEDCFLKFNGMWAIAIWDERKRLIVLSRDRFGVKPLHYVFIPNKLFAFASETVAFRSLAGFERRFDEENLVRGMHAQNTLEPLGETIFTNIKQLLPGHCLAIKSNQAPKIRKWWDLRTQLPKVPVSFDDQVQEFRELFIDACRIRLRSDVPIASALSGGLDSTAVYCMLPYVVQNVNNERITENWSTAFSMTFPGSINDELHYIEDVLKKTGGKGIILEPDTSNLVSELVNSTVLSDIISGTPLNCLTPVYRAMHQNGIVVSMDGHGVDEYLYGYQSSVVEALLQAYMSEDQKYAATLEDTIRAMSDSDSGQTIANIKKRALDLNQLQGNVFSSIKKALKKQIDFKAMDFVFSELETSFLLKDRILPGRTANGLVTQVLSKSNLGERRLLEEFHYTDLPYNLRDFDRGSMQHQIEIRMPFMDYRLVTYSMALPQKSKLNGGYTKYILREAMRGIMPESIRSRKLKIGLSAPLADWFNGELNVFLLDLVHSGKLLSNSLLDAEKVKEEVCLRCKNLSWDVKSSQRVWPIINYLLLKES